MKPLYNYIKEAVEISNKDGYYRTVTLVRHEGIDCEKLTAEEFVKLMMADLDKANTEYKKLVGKEAKERHQEYVERRVKEAEVYAEKTWKTDKKRKEYIENARKNAEDNKWHLNDYGVFFDFKPEVGNSLPQDCVLVPGRVTKQQLESCFNFLSASKWWKKGTGWALKYNCTQDTFVSSFRGWVDLLMDESATAERRREQENLDKAISAWYASGRYMGD